ncbi:hypothetical protein ACU4GI_21640 [Cupriavidus basilensis]
MRTLDLTRLDAITPELIERATQEHDLDTALWPLQIAAGIEAGDTAGLFFSFMDGENSQWFDASPAERKRWLLGWIGLEKRHAGFAG